MSTDTYSLMTVSALIFFMCSVPLCFSPVLETSGRAICGAFGSAVCLLSLALHNLEAFKVTAPIIGTVLTGMLFISALMVWRPLERHRAFSEASKQFPLATRPQLKSVASKMLSGSRVTSFCSVDGRIMFGRGQHAIWCGAEGQWEHVPVQKISDYQPEEEVLLKALPNAHSILAKEVVHELCSRLYFNWSIDALELHESHLSVTLSRRNTKITKRYACATKTCSANH